jgi:glycosyltransferase involved in cell wall biosynthesis
MRMLFLAPKVNLDKPCGGTLHYLDLTECMAKANPGIEIYLVASGREKSEKKAKNLTIITDPGIDTSIWHFREGKRKSAYLNSIVKQIGPDFVYCRTEPFELFPILASLECPGLIEISYNLFSKSYDVSPAVAFLWPLRNAALKAWMRKAVARFGSVLTVSDSSKKCLQKRISKPINVVRTGVNLGKFRGSRKNKYGRIVFVGNSLKYQGVHLLIEASRLLEKQGIKHEIVVVGSHDPAKYNAPASVKFLGPLSNKAAVKEMEACSIGVAPYMEAENEPFGFSPVKILEYMAAGLAVVATDTEWNRELIKEKNGLLFRSGSAEDLAEKLKHLLSGGRELKRMQEFNKSEAKRIYRWEKISDEIVAIARKSLAARA